uniref:Class II aldolase/adducin family protein n=1 Tax=candidate division WOR-3 bacterium TaxID=2052148 RepID=A0A7C3J618_UNCW3
MKKILSSLKILSENIFTKDLSEGGSGNISFLLGENKKNRVYGEIKLPEKLQNLEEKSFLITSTGSRFYQIKDEPKKYISLFYVDKKGERVLLLNDKRPSSEILTHLAIYDSLFKVGSDVRCVLHLHSRYSLVLASFLKKKNFNLNLRKTHTEFEIIFKKEIEIVERLKPGSLELAKELGKKSILSDTIILKDHGIFSYGKDLFETYDRVEILESLSKIYLLKSLFYENLLKISSTNLK